MYNDDRDCIEAYMDVESITELVDPDEFCVHCGKKISGRYHECPFCGKVWWKYE